MEFKNKTAIITGGSVGIGKATALELAKSGANVCLVDVNVDGLNATAEEIKSLGAGVEVFVCDVSDEQRVREVVGEIIHKYKKIDILINNAGIWRTWKNFIETTSDDWKKRISVNVLGLMYFTHAVLPNMIENSYGRIVNVGSVAGVYGNSRMVDYSMTKGAVSSFTKALAKEVASEGITVNNVVPGTVRNEGAGAEIDQCYMGRRGELHEYAHLICFLASDKASYISGQDYQIDGYRKSI